MLEEMKAGTITATLPDPPEGWKAGGDPQGGYPAVHGRGRVTVKRLYEEKDGDKKIELEVIFESGLSEDVHGVDGQRCGGRVAGFQGAPDRSRDVH
jgi:hypothetical protein